MDTFAEITKEMIALQLVDGHLDHIDQVRSECINPLFNDFPFTMMTKISQGDWVLAESES